MRWLGRIVTLVTAGGALLLGCGDEPAEALVTLDRAVYFPGATGTARLANEGPGDLRYNMCPRRLERRTDGQWSVAPEFPADRACPEVLYRLVPGASTTDEVVFPDPLASGEYRWVFTALSRETEFGVTFHEAASTAVDVVNVATQAGSLPRATPTSHPVRH